MKMVKSLLLGAAAGLVAVAGAQAADLPVKAKPVQYVKICSLYGAGFYYIPGTDTCMKIGGYVRSEWNWQANGSFNPQLAGSGGLNTRNSNPLINRTRGLFSFDVRSQTELGTLRSYVRAGWQWTTLDAITGGSGAVTYLDRAFIQLGGWTFGKTESFSQFNLADWGMSNQTQYLFMDTSGSGTPVIAYTAQFGGGWSASIALEEHWEIQTPVFAVGGVGGFALAAPASGMGGAAGGFVTPAAQTAGVKVPDAVINLRVDQAWGSAQIAGALHNDSASYYAPTTIGSTTHPNDKLGGAILGGIMFNLPMLAKGDQVGISGAWCNGAAGYCVNNGAPNASTMFGIVRGNGVALGLTADAFYNNAPATLGGLELTKLWNVNAGIQHYWVPTLRTSLWGTYLNFKANSSAVDTIVCPAAFTPAGVPLGAGCGDFSAWQVGSRTVWNPVTNMDISLEAMYSKVKTAFNGAAIVGTVGTPAVLTAGDQGQWSGILRFQRNFWP